MRLEMAGVDAQEIWQQSGRAREKVVEEAAMLKTHPHGTQGACGASTRRSALEHEERSHEAHVPQTHHALHLVSWQEWICTVPSMGVQPTAQT